MRVKRDVEVPKNLGGFWSARTKDKVIVDLENQVIGYMKTLNFHAFVDQNRIRGKAHPTAWIMHEYRLANNDVSFIS